MASRLTELRAGLGRRLPALALIGLGLAALYEALSLPFGTVRQPDSGFYPTVVCVLLIVFGGLALADPARSPLDQEADDSGVNARVWLIVAALAAYAWALTPVGFVLCTAALLVLLLRAIGGVSWTASAAAAAIGSSACYGAFTRLGLPLPAGVLGF